MSQPRDPNRTAPVGPVEPGSNPETVDATGAYQPAGATEPHVPALPADAPTIPGYAINAEIARGGMGRVYAGRDLTLDREVAIKTLLPGANAERFVTEAKITARLQHPGVPSVHALGTLDDGSPYLAMKLIGGRTLSDLLKERSSPGDGLSRFVQVFEQIAQAVGFAHARGVIHRDLKPLNVMVGAFGEVQVMDWGLAKDVRGRDREVADERPGGDSPAHTAAGSVMGTPGYMAPEQARGEPVDARADVFALGSTLAAILTGRPAFVGTGVRETIERAARADLADVMSRLDGCGADAELVAVARRCLAANAAERPADAQAVAAEVAAYRAGVEARLRRAETEAAEALVREAEQRKRRRQLLLAAGAVTLTLLAGLAASLWQMGRAVAAEGRAREERDAKARALEAETEARTRAMAALRAMTDEIVENQMARGATLTEENKAFLRTTLKQFEGFASITSDDAESRSLRAEGLYRVGTMRARLGEMKEAEGAFREALAIRRPLVADFPDRHDFRRELATSHQSLGVLLSHTGRLKEAEAYQAEALAVRRQLAADFPDRPDFRLDLADNYNSHGLVLRDAGRAKEAEGAYDQALAIYKQLAADFPTRFDFRRELASTHNNLGLLLSDTGRNKQAEWAYEQAVAVYKQLAAALPTRPAIRQALATSHNNLGALLLTTGRVKEAEGAYRQALAVRRQLAADFPARPDFRRELASSQYVLGDLLRVTGRPKEAEAALADALAISKQLVADHPTRPDFREGLAASHHNLGSVLAITGRLKEAEGAYEQALAIRRQVVADFPDKPAYRQELARSLNNLGGRMKDAGRPKQAEAAYAEALAVRRQLAADFPARPDFHQDLAASYNNLGILLRATGRPREAEAAWRDALAIYKQLAADLPNQPEVRNALAGACVNLAILCKDRGDMAAAKGYLIEARPHHAAALKANPRHPDYRRFFRNNQLVLTTAHAGLLERAEAVASAEEIRDQGWDPPDDAYDAGAALSECIPVVEKHDRLDTNQRQEAVRFYGDEAMKLLRDAVKKGCLEVKDFKQDPDLAPLRKREDFKKLVADVEAKTKK
ncbi:MAG: tetratricopeptide repeat protein [Gemmataceae bacterium]